MTGSEEGTDSHGDELLQRRPASLGVESLKA